MSDKIKTGLKGEKLAADFLAQKGYSLITENFRHGKGEIDLIVQKNELLVFVEVKTRTSVDFGEPEEFVDMIKAAHIMTVADEYIYRFDWEGDVRFDVVSVKLSDDHTDVLEIEHLEDAIN